MSSNIVHIIQVIQSSTGREILQELVEKIVTQYKTDSKEVETLLVEDLKKNPDLISLLESGSTKKRLQKSSLYKNFSKGLKSKLYYQLRRYDVNEAERTKYLDLLRDSKLKLGSIAFMDCIYHLGQSHISTKERIEEQYTLYTHLNKFFGEAKTFLDIGCGIQPIFFPFIEKPEVLHYMALDKSVDSIETLNIFSNHLEPGLLDARVWKIEEGWNAFSGEPFDVALLLKLIPVVERIQREDLEILLQTPAKTWVLSGVKNSMVKKQSVEKRERNSLLHFIEQTGKSIIGEFELEEEFFYIVE